MQVNKLHENESNQSSQNSSLGNYFTALILFKTLTVSIGGNTVGCCATDSLFAALCLVLSHGSLKLAMVGIFTAQQLENTKRQNLPFTLCPKTVMRKMLILQIKFKGGCVFSDYAISSTHKKGNIPHIFKHYYPVSQSCSHH